jgi:hypothetical protein
MIGLVVMAVLTPFGVFLPELFNAGDAWGEWGTETVQEMFGFVPEGMEKLSSLWNSLIPDYNIFPENSPLVLIIISYFISAAVGSLLVYFLIKLIMKLSYRNEEKTT